MSIDRGQGQMTRTQPDLVGSGHPAKRGTAPDGGSSNRNGSATLADAALQSIVDLIRRGDLRPGAVVNEVDLAKRFAMSRGPVREALRRLQGRKLITREPFQRARVVKLGRREVLAIFELREALEGMACRLATARMTDEQLKELLLSANSEPTRDTPSDFHAILARNCGNARIEELLSTDLYDLLLLYRWISIGATGRLQQARREHRQIARAMIARKVELAESLIRSHIRRIGEALSREGD
jgi:DNA-binding GntR family transcriptional regulator